MPDIDITRLIEDADPFDFSASVAERGQNAGPETWANANAEATARPLDMDDADRAACRDYFEGFGAWDRDEIDGWSNAELDALILQHASGDVRELESLCPGYGLGDIDWTEAEKLAERGTISGRVFASGDRLFNHDLRLRGTAMLTIGDKLWNGAIVTPQLAAAYNGLQARIEGFRAEGRAVPESLLNGAHNLIAGARA